MKARADAILQPEQATYLDRLLASNVGLLEEMEQFAAEHHVPISDREVARFLEITARAAGARRVLEIGMAIGYAVVHFARALPDDGLVVTIEPNEDMIAASEVYLRRAGLSEKVRIERGAALDVLPRLTETFDLVYLDAVKEEYSDYLELALPLLRTGGLLIADNLLWGGLVAGDETPREKVASTQALREFNQRFIRHPQLLSVVLPVGDGLGYGIKIN